MYGGFHRSAPRPLDCVYSNRKRNRKRNREKENIRYIKNARWNIVRFLFAIYLLFLKHFFLSRSFYYSLVHFQIRTRICGVVVAVVVINIIISFVCEFPFIHVQHRGKNKEREILLWFIVTLLLLLFHFAFYSLILSSFLTSFQRSPFSFVNNSVYTAHSCAVIHVCKPVNS